MSQADPTFQFFLLDHLVLYKSQEEQLQQSNREWTHSHLEWMEMPSQVADSKGKGLRKPSVCLSLAA